MARWTHQLRLHSAAERLYSGASPERITFSNRADLACCSFDYPRFHLFDSCDENQSADDDCCRPGVSNQFIRLVETANFEVTSRSAMESPTSLNKAGTFGEYPDQSGDSNTLAHCRREFPSSSLARLILIGFTFRSGDHIPDPDAHADVR